MGSAEMQGGLWGTHPRDLAELFEQLGLPLFGAALDAGLVGRGSRFLDAGCGAGLAALLARLRGAIVSAVDASGPLVDIASERLPGADIRQADLEALPFEEGTFDAVIAVNSVFYASDQVAAVRELARVTRPGGRVVVTSWGPPERCQSLSDVIVRLRPLLPPPAPGAAPAGPGALAAPGALAGLLREAGLSVVEEGETACPFVFRDAETSWLAARSAGPNQAAIRHSGEEAVRAALAEADLAHGRPDGSIRYENVFLWVSAERPR
jgi:SAM-dependent methyltransferase